VKSKKKISKPFDCVGFKRRAQARIFRKIKGLTAEQEFAYFDKATRTGPFAQLWSELVAKGRKTRASGRLPSSIRRTA
jgi:hypothetical protein